MKQFLIPLLIVLSVSSKARAEQNYSGNSVLDCNIKDKNGPSSAFLYTCNGLNKSCLTFLIFKSQPPYNTVASISNLTSSDPQKLATINKVSMLTMFPTGKEVIVPVNCYCKTKDYFQADTNYTLPTILTYFTIANDTFEGLTTCNSLIRFNPYGPLDLLAGMQIHVPLRCACPTQSQIASGIKYLLTYPVDWGDNVSYLASRFKVSSSSVLEANVITTPSLYPFTTLLIPLTSEPDSSTTIIHPGRPPSFTPPVSPTKKSKADIKVYVAIAISGGFVLVGCVILFYLFLLRRRPVNNFVEAGKIKKSDCKSSDDIRDEIAGMEHVSRVYRFEEIKEATENFSAKNKIEGSVYRGLFGKEILAVKKMSSDASKEVNMLKKINHFNVIQLQGYCKNEGFFYLVFEFMENGSLRDWLGKSIHMKQNSLTKRIEIALDIANGLQYLHNFTEPCYVHKDINSSNILLNKDTRAKIANFRLAGKISERDSVSCTSQVVGTRGYMAPEYVEAGLVSPKMDVYAFGVVLLELITGKDSIFIQAGNEVMLSTVIGSVMSKEGAEANLSAFIDPSLSGSNEKAWAFELAKISVACLMQEPARRPSMSDVVSSLIRIPMNVSPRISPTINSNFPRMGR